MINKIVQTMAEAMAGIRDGAVVLVGGFGSIGQPNALIEGLIEQGAKDLTVVANNSGVGYVGLAKLLDTGRVRKSSARFRAPPIRWCSSGCGAKARSSSNACRRAPWRSACAPPAPAFRRSIRRPRSAPSLRRARKSARSVAAKYILEEALQGDVALVEAWEADRWGNLTYKSSARNFNPVMATAAKLTIVQSQHIVELGALDPEKIATAGIFVDRVLHLPYGEPTVT